MAYLPGNVVGITLRQPSVLGNHQACEQLPLATAPIRSIAAYSGLPRDVRAAERRSRWSLGGQSRRQAPTGRNMATAVGPIDPRETDRRLNCPDYLRRPRVR